MDTLKPWLQKIMWTFIILFIIGLAIFIVLGSAKYGLLLWESYKAIGWFGIIFFVLGTLGMGLLWVTVNFTMAVVRRIFKLKWLQLPLE